MIAERTNLVPYGYKIPLGRRDEVEKKNSLSLQLVLWRYGPCEARFVTKARVQLGSVCVISFSCHATFLYLHLSDWTRCLCLLLRATFNYCTFNIAKAPSLTQISPTT